MFKPLFGFSRQDRVIFRRETQFQVRTNTPFCPRQKVPQERAQKRAQQFQKTHSNKVVSEKRRKYSILPRPMKENEMRLERDSNSRPQDDTGCQGSRGILRNFDENRHSSLNQPYPNPRLRVKSQKEETLEVAGR